MMSKISFCNLPYCFRNRFIQLLPSQIHIKFIQTSSTALKESMNARQIYTMHNYNLLPYSRLFLSNNHNMNFEMQRYNITFYLGYNIFNTFKFDYIDELVLKIDKAVINDAIKAYQKLYFTKLTIVMMEDENINTIFDSILLSPKCQHLKIYGYISAEYLFKMSHQLLHFESITIKNLNPSFPVLNLKELRKYYTVFLSTSNRSPSKFEIIQIVPDENVINVLEFVDERFILHSYVQPEAKMTFLFYE